MHIAIETAGGILDRRQRDLERLWRGGCDGVEHAAEYGRGYARGMVAYRCGTPADTRTCFEIFEASVDDLAARTGGSANATAGEPDAFEIRRDKKQHLALGHGIHVCLGAALARLEMRVSLEEIHRRIPDYEVEYDALERMHSGNVRGYSRMPLRFTPAR